MLLLNYKYSDRNFIIREFIHFLRIKSSKKNTCDFTKFNILSPAAVTI